MVYGDRLAKNLQLMRRIVLCIIIKLFIGDVKDTMMLSPSFQ